MEITIEDGIGSPPGIIDDNFLYLNTSTANYGAFVYASLGFAQRRRVLLRVDLADYTDIIVSSVKFSMHSYSSSSINMINTWWNRVLREWGEGTKTGQTAGTGESSWNHYSVPDEWTIAGCKGEGDMEPSPQNAVALSYSGQGWVDFDCLPSSVKLDLGSTFSIVIYDNTTSNYNNFSSTDDSSSNKPYFYMEYTTLTKSIRYLKQSDKNILSRRF